MGFTIARARAILDAEIVDGDKVRYSENGSTVSANLAATTIAAWDPATDADPAVRQNTNAVDSAAATGAGTFTHTSVWDSAETVQKTDWEAITGGSKTLGIGDKLEHAAGAIKVTLT